MSIYHYLTHNIMNKILELIKQRRVWASVIGVVLFLAGVFGVDWGVDSTKLTDLVTNVGVAVANLFAAFLALWSYLKPKQK